MKIIVDYDGDDADLNQLKIDSALYLGEYKIRIKFSDGKDVVVDFRDFLSKSFHPEIQKYLNENNFSSFSLVDGNLNWNNYDLIFPLSDLYNGEI